MSHVHRLRTSDRIFFIIVNLRRALPHLGILIVTLAAACLGALEAAQIRAIQARENTKDGLKYVAIPRGTFEMGCSTGDSDCGDDESPRHRVTLTKDFWMGQTEVTVGAYKHFAQSTGKKMPTSPIYDPTWSNEQLPMTNVTWDDAREYCTWSGGRLPSEAEWEYAARGGSPRSTYGPLDAIAWYEGNSGSGMHPVSTKLANRFGLYDTLGSVWEWVADWYDAHYYLHSALLDPAGPAKGEYRVLRGGSWIFTDDYIRVSYRLKLSQNGWNGSNGFRCARDAAP